MDSPLREMCIENRKTEVEPALVLAYDFYEDPDREAEMNRRKFLALAFGLVSVPSFASHLESRWIIDSHGRKCYRLVRVEHNDNSGNYVSDGKEPEGMIKYSPPPAPHERKLVYTGWGGDGRDQWIDTETGEIFYTEHK